MTTTESGELMPPIPPLPEDSPIGRLIESRTGIGPQYIRVDDPEIYSVDDIEKMRDAEFPQRVRGVITRIRAACLVAATQCRLTCYIAAHPILLKPSARAVARSLAATIEPALGDDRIAIYRWYVQMGRSAIARRKRHNWSRETA
jgi:hypothetical protein